MSEPTCPKCRGKSGYYHVSIQRHIQSNYFNHKPMNCDVEFVRGGTKKYCSDCDRDITDFVAVLNNELGTFKP